MKDAPTKPSWEESVLDMEQSVEIAAMKDAPTKSRREEYALGTERMFLRRNAASVVQRSLLKLAATKDAPTFL